MVQPLAGIRRVIRNSLRWMLRYPRLVRIGSWILQKQPGTAARLLRMADLTTPYVPARNYGRGRSQKATDRLSEPARAIYSELKAGYRRRDK